MIFADEPEHGHDDEHDLGHDHEPGLPFVGFDGPAEWVVASELPTVLEASRDGNLLVAAALESQDSALEARVPAVLAARLTPATFRWSSGRGSPPARRPRTFSSRHMRFPAMMGTAGISGIVSAEPGSDKDRQDQTQDQQTRQQDQKQTPYLCWSSG